MLNEHAKKLNDRLRKMRLEKPPSVWKNSTTFAIGGLMQVGYADDTDLLLVVSSQGRGLFDCITGERIARDYESPFEKADWYDSVRLTAFGIGFISNQQIKLAGLNGGGLSRVTFDDWSLEIVAPDYPIENVILSPPQKSVLVESLDNGCVKISEDAETIACGFSNTGRSFIIAWSHTLEIYSRVDLQKTT